jgi:adenine-specific DNA-methyltransferase
MLTDRDKELIKRCIDRGEPLPSRYKLMLFADAPEVELVWQGKSSEVTNVVLPFQSIEQIDEPRQERGKMEQVGGSAGLFAVDAGGRQAAGAAGGWSNKLIWGDNKLVLSSLKNGPMRKAIEDAGGLKLVYIDPPFDVGADFNVKLDVGGEELIKERSIIEDVAYRDTWGRGADSYVQMMYERLIIIRGLMARGSSVFVHVDWRVNGMLRCILDEVFGRGAAAGDRPGMRNQIAYCYSGGGIPAKEMPRKYDTIFWHSLDMDWTFNPIYRAYSEGTVQRGRTAVKGPDAVLREEGTPVNDWWPDVKKITSPTDPEKLYYDTQKSEELLDRVIRMGSNPGDLVADFFCGSGTTLAVAEKLGRKWIGCDLGRFAIHTTRKRLIGVQRQLKAEGKPYRSFEILNLGKYERQYFVGIDPTLPEKERREEAVRREEHYLSLILTAYKAERAFQSPPFHGKKNATMVVVGPIDAPVTQSQVAEVVGACAKLRVSKVDVLGFEFEMGLAPQAQDDAKAKGVTLSLKYIPKDVFDKRAVEKGQVKFYDVAYIEVKPKVTGKKVSVELTDFGVFYQQDATSEIAEELKPGTSRVTVEAGQVVKVSKDKKGIVTRERLTKKWTDWIDYWAVDFDYESRPEFLRVVEAAPDDPKGYREVRTGGYIFENEWQSFRTRKDRTLELKSAERDYAKPGRYKLAIKVIDIFGNDTTKVVEVKV